MRDFKLLRSRWLGPFALFTAIAALAGCSSNGSSAIAPEPVDAGTADAAEDAAPPNPDDDPAYREAVVGSKWQKLETAPKVSGKQDDLFFVTPELGWSVNGEGRIFRTDDGGATWTTLLEKPGTFFRSILMVSETRGFAGNIGPDYFPGVTDKAPLYETSDRGQTWSPVTTVSGPAPTGICNMHRLDAQHLFAAGRVGGPSFVLTSTDGGATWQSKDLSSKMQMLIDVRFTSPESGMVVGMNNAGRCAIYRTGDGGDSWQQAFASKHDGSLCWKISFPSDRVGYVSIQGAEVSSFAKTIDGGETWEEKPLIEGAFNGLGAGFITETIGWMAGPTKAYRTTDGGETWKADSSLGAAINRFRFVDKHTAYAIGSTIYKLTVP